MVALYREDHTFVELLVHTDYNASLQDRKEYPSMAEVVNDFECGRTRQAYQYSIIEILGNVQIKACWRILRYEY